MHVKDDHPLFALVIQQNRAIYMWFIVKSLTLLDLIIIILSPTYFYHLQAMYNIHHTLYFIRQIPNSSRLIVVPKYHNYSWYIILLMISVFSFLLFRW